jgi:hypothetical protein
MDELMQARGAYFEAFGNEGPYPFGVTDEALAAVLLAAVEKGEPVPDEFDWYKDLPDGAVA